MAWVYPMKNVDCKTTIHCLKDVFEKCGETPEKIQTDKGSEFKCNLFTELMQDNNIEHYFSTSDRKCAVVERFNLTIQQLLFKLMANYNTYAWTQLLADAVSYTHLRAHET